MNSHRKVQLRVAARADKPLASVAVAGEISAWDLPIEANVEPDDHGVWRGEMPLHLPAGMYGYKLIVNGAWCLDEEALRTRSENGRRNHVLSVGGTSEPVLFAPGRPWIAEMGRGGVRIVAALRNGFGESLVVGWRESAYDRDHAMTMHCVGVEDEHRIFESRLPISSGSADLWFVLEDGSIVADEDDRRIHWHAPPDTTPDWWHRAVIYTVFVDRFRPRALHPRWSRDPGPQKYAGGHLDGVTHALPALAKMGVNLIYLTPIHPGANCHRYDMTDPFRVDPRLGGDAALERLIAKAHDLGMRIALDFTCSHAGDGFPQYEDVKLHGARSRYASWFQWTKQRRKLRHYGTRKDAPLFNLLDTEVREFFLKLVRHWADRGVDALRLDAAAEIPFDLARQFRQTFKECRPDGVVFAEFVHLHSYRFLDEEGADATTEFGFFDTFVPFLAHGHLDAADVARRLLVIERERGGPFFRAVRFLCTHDHPRLATLARLRGRSHVVPLGFLLLFTLPGIPMLLYGEELGLYADRPEQTLEHVWPDRMPMPWFDDESREKPFSFEELITNLTSLRRQCPTLVEGELSFVHGEGQVLVYRREADGVVLDVALNAGTDEVDVALDDDHWPAAELLMAVGPARLDGIVARLGPGGGVIVRRKLEEPSRQKLIRAGNSILRDRDFGASLLQVKSRPTRLDFAITERCNLRCAHCITDAPARTASRQARQWSPWIVDLLRDDLTHAEHFAFVHGGESLVSPILDNVLAAIEHARRGLPTMIHVLTNGVLLTEQKLEHLVNRGVRSISISLDGATADVNDTIRVGGRFDLVVSHLRAAVKLRNERRLDLRLGVSCVVLSQNVSQLQALVELCAQLGVDWLKLEEVAPVTEFAARSLVRMDQGFALDAVRQACARGKQLGLVMVDHTVDRARWRCELDAAAADFLEADGFANRTFIHPCRGAWEIACIEANGDVRIGDFFGPILGNLAESPLATLWNGAMAEQARRAAMAKRLCKEGPVVCR